MKKNIIFWCPHIGNVGTAKAVLESAKSLSQSRNFECKILNVFGEFDKYRSFLKKNKIKEIKLINNRLIKKLPTEGFFWSRLNYLLVFLICFFPLFFYLTRNKNNYLFVYLLTSLPLLVISLFNLDNKIILRISGKVRLSYIRKFIFFISKKKIKRVLIQTLESKNRFLKNKIFDKKSLSLIRDPIIDHKKIDLLKNEKIEKKFLKKRYFVSIGRLTYQKNFLFLVKCIKKIIRYEKNYNFLILGEGKEQKKIQEYISRFGLTKYIILVGYKKNIFKYIKNSIGLICTSLWEEPGFIIQEAAACRKIILTSDCYTGPSEFLENGKNGYVFKNNNQKSFEKSFKKLLLEKKYHLKKINRSYGKTKFYSPEFFLKEIKKILS
tara:strand:- start:9846 stop:10985 length:1140 start_codon:yes stop_codon:yes gene_type:complete